MYITQTPELAVLLQKANESIGVDLNQAGVFVSVHSLSASTMAVRPSARGYTAVISQEPLVLDVAIHPNVPHAEALMTMAHELTHVKQHIEGRLIPNGNAMLFEGAHVPNGDDVASYEQYISLPHEIEAMRNGAKAVFGEAYHGR